MGTRSVRSPTSFPMNSMESSEGQELQNLGSGAWDNPAYSGPSSTPGTLRICTISSAVPPHPQPKKPEDEPQENTHRILVSSCCLQICRGIRGSWYRDHRVRRRGHQKLLRWGMLSEEKVKISVSLWVCKLCLSCMPQNTKPSLVVFQR